MRPAYSIVFSAQVNGATGPLAVGDVVLPSASDPAVYVLASAANRGTRRSEAVVLTPYGGTGIGSIELQQTATLDASISGLGAGTASLVRVSTTGRLERVSSAGLTDDVCGLAEADGRVHLFFGLPQQFVQAITLAYSAGLTTFLTRILQNGTPIPAIAFQGDVMGITFPSLSITGDNVTIDCNASLSVQRSGSQVIGSNGAACNVGLPLAGSQGFSVPLRTLGASVAISGNTTLTAAQYECPFIDLTGAPGAGFDLFLPNTAGATFNIKNGTGQACSVKRVGGTFFVTLAAGTTRWFRHNGTEYEVRQ